MITLTRTTPVLGGVISVNTARCTWASPTISILSAVAASWLIQSVIPVLPSEVNVVTVTIANPGTAAISLSASCHVFAAGTVLIGSTYGATVTINAGDSYTWTLTSATSPAAVQMRVDVNLTSTSGTGWTARVDAMASTVTATADEVIAGTLSRDQNRADTDTSAGLRLVQGVIGTRSGTLTYLCSTWAQVAAIDSLYRAGAVAIAAVDAVLPAITHYAIGKVRATLERALAGRPAKWLVTVDFREAN